MPLKKRDASVSLQFKVPAVAAERFQKLVYENYGMKYGGKTQMFLDLVNEASFQPDFGEGTDGEMATERDYIDATKNTNMDFAEAVAIVDRSLDGAISGDDAMKLSTAQMILASEYVQKRHLIMPS